MCIRDRRDAIARQEAITAKVERGRTQLIALDAEVRATMAAVVEGSHAKLREVAEGAVLPAVVTGS